MQQEKGDEALLKALRAPLHEDKLAAGLRRGRPDRSSMISSWFRAWAASIPSCEHILS